MKYDPIKRHERYLRDIENGKVLVNPIKREEWLEANRDVLNAKKRAKHLENRDEILVEKKARYQKDRDKLLAAAKIYRKNNRAKIRESQRRYYATHPEARMARALRGRIINALKGNKKSRRTFDLVGCSLSELRTYLEGLFQPGMTWDNWGKDRGKWHIDHIKPLAGLT